MTVKIINTSNNPLPEYKTKGSAGIDLRAFIESSCELKPLERKAIPTGIFIEMSGNMEAQIRPRSGLSLKEGLVAFLGTIDTDYRGEIKIILVNFSDTTKIINNGDRIAQMIFSEYQKVNLEEARELSKTERGAGGFGSTGKN